MVSLARQCRPAEWLHLPAIKRRVAAVREFRLQSTAAPTRKAAEKPATFFYQSQPATPYIAVPEVSSENRPYIPIALLPPTIIASKKLYLIESSDTYLFGVLSSTMHMAWVKVVAGRLESRFQYSGTMVYNTFPWPVSVAEQQMAKVRAAAAEVLRQRVECGDGRLGFLPKPNENGRRSTLAELYHPLAMPRALAKAHIVLDRAVDRCYRKEPFPSDRARVEHLFALYEQLTAPLVAAVDYRRKHKPRRSPPDDSTAESSAAAAHFHFLQEDPVPYRTGES